MNANAFDTSVGSRLSLYVPRAWIPSRWYSVMRSSVDVDGAEKEHFTGIARRQSLGDRLSCTNRGDLLRRKPDVLEKETVEIGFQLRRASQRGRRERNRQSPDECEAWKHSPPAWYANFTFLSSF